MNKPVRICLIYTGGTIGMQRLPNGTLVPPSNPRDFLDRVAPELPKLFEYDFVELMNKDSTNMTPDDWTKIAEVIYEKYSQNTYDGFVVAHGTDTMHFTASAVAFALGNNLSVPVVFTGAQTNPEVAHGDARVNLIRACKVCSTQLAEVAIVFGEFIFRGCRAQKKDERRFDAFESPALFPLGYVTEEILLHPLATRRPASPKPLEFSPHFAEGVLQVSLIPGLRPSLLQPILASPECTGIILQSFGAGNVPDEAPYSFRELIERATDLLKPVIVTSQFPANETLHTAYRPGRAAIEAGAIPTGNMTSSCAVAKFRWVLAGFERDLASRRCRREDRISEVNARMQHIYIGEMGDPSPTRPNDDTMAHG